MSLILSIIIPCYNCERTLEEAVESCYLQGLKENEFEVVMVDDKSTDHTRDVMAMIVKRHNNIKIYHHESNLGGGATRNTAISKTAGDKIFCLDSDDILPAETLPKMITFMEKRSCDGVLFEESRLFKGKNHKKVNIIRNKILNRPIKLGDTISGKNGFLMKVNFLYKKASFLASGGYTTRHGFDTQSFGLRFLNKGFKVYVCPESYYYHRLHNASYFRREYLSGKISFNAYLAYEDIFHLFSKSVKNDLLKYDIFNKITSIDNLDQFIENKLEVLGPDNFFIQNYESYLSKTGEVRLYEQIKNSEEITDLVSIGIYYMKYGDFNSAISLFEKALLTMPDSKIIQMNLLRASMYAKNFEGVENKVLDKFAIKRNAVSIFVAKIYSKIKNMTKITNNIKIKLGRSFWLRTALNIFHWIYKYPHFIGDYLRFKKMNLDSKLQRFKISFSDTFPSLFDNTKKTSFDPHYTYHPAWAARIIAKIKPEKHVDISSILHFSTLVSAFVPVEFYDYRPADVKLDNLQCKKADLNRLPFQDNSLVSLSCMHTLEHVGLGRYGDKLDPDGDFTAARELVRVVKSGGTLLFVAPMGRPRIEYNSHRIYSYDQVMDMFDGMQLKEFSLIPDNFKDFSMIINANKELVKDQLWACGCFWFIKK